MLRYRSLGAGAALVAAAALTLHAQSASQTRKLRANGTDLAYVEQGRGAPVVFVHGAIADLRFWEPQREAVARRHRFIAYTFRYHGTAPWPDQGTSYSVDTHVADLSAFLAGLKAGPAHVVGLSYGGLLAGLVAAKNPELVRTVTLAEPALMSLLADTPDGKATLGAWEQQVGPIIVALKEGDSTKAAKMLSSVVTGVPLEAFDKLPAPLQQVLLDNARTMPLLFSGPMAGPTCESLRSVKAPTLLIRGERTPPLFVKTTEAVGRCIPGSRQVVIPNASHAMSYDNPAAFNDAVLRFLAEDERRKPGS